MILKSGAWVTVLVLLPNLVWMVLPKDEPIGPGDEPLWLTIVENAGRIAVLLIPFFYALDFSKRFSVPVTIGMGVALAFYYAAWIRYFAGGQAAHLFSAPLLGISLPMAVMPVLFYLLSAYLMGSWPMLVASLWFGAAHIWISALTLR